MLQQAVKEMFNHHEVINKPMYRPEVQKVIDQHHLKYVLAQFVDIHGAAKTKSVPISGLKAIEKDGVGFEYSARRVHFLPKVQYLHILLRFPHSFSLKLPYHLLCQTKRWFHYRRFWHKPA